MKSASNEQYSPRGPRCIQTALVVWHGFQANVADAVAQFLVGKSFKTFVVRHPMTQTDTFHEYGELGPNGFLESTRTLRRTRLITDYLLSVGIPRKLPDTTLSISFACTHTLRLIVRRLIRKKVQLVVHWNIDYSPRRFENQTINKAYNILDRVACKYADVQVDLTNEARSARLSNYGLQKSAKNLVVPLGVWTHDLVSHEVIRNRMSLQEDGRYQFVFLGNLSTHQGIIQSVDAFELLLNKFPDSHFHIVGSGPATTLTKAKVLEKQIDQKVTLHGRLTESSFRKILRESTIGLAPYQDSEESFSHFADPGKIKEYLAAGLPIITTAVPPIARSLVQNNCGLITNGAASEIASAVEDLLQSQDGLRKFSFNALNFALDFTWDKILETFWTELYTNNLLGPCCNSRNSRGQR